MYQEFTLFDEFKCCTKCGNSFPATSEFFFRDKRGRNGLGARCKPCRTKENLAWQEANSDHYQAKRKEYREEHKEKQKAYHRQWREDNAEHLKAYREENKEHLRWLRKRYYDNNKEREHAAKKLYPQEYKDYLAAKRLEWSRTEEGRALKAFWDQTRRNRRNNLPCTFTMEQWQECLIHFDNCCAYCGKPSKLEKEHFVPLLSGGGFVADNIVPACKPCNSGKKDSDFFDWYPPQPFYSPEREETILMYLNEMGGG